VVSVTSRPPLPNGKTRYPFYRKLGGHQGRSGRVEILVPTGIRSRTVQLVLVVIPTELPGPYKYIYIYIYKRESKLSMKVELCEVTHEQDMVP